MAQSNAYQYPLPFPNEAQRIQVASYSSLANALGSDPGYANRHERASRTCDSVADAQYIYLDEPPVNNPSYPYPARNLFNPGTYLARASSPMSSRTDLTNANLPWDENNGHNNLLGPPARYDRLPQPTSVERDMPYGYQTEVEYATVHFLRKGDEAPYTLWDLLTMDTMPDLVDGDLPVFAQNPDRWIKIQLIWPGYSRYPYEKRLPTKRDACLTPNLLLMALAYHIEKFARWIHNEGAIVEAGQEQWAITGVTEGISETWKSCIITSLYHRTGSVWQPEIYYPRR